MDIISISIADHVPTNYTSSKNNFLQRINMTELRFLQLSNLQLPISDKQNRKESCFNETIHAVYLTFHGLVTLTIIWVIMMKISSFSYLGKVVLTISFYSLLQSEEKLEKFWKNDFPSFSLLCKSTSRPFIENPQFEIINFQNKKNVIIFTWT